MSNYLLRIKASEIQHIPGMYETFVTRCHVVFQKDYGPLQPSTNA